MVGPAAAAPAMFGKLSRSHVSGPAAAVCCLMRWLHWLQVKQSSEPNTWLHQAIPLQCCLLASHSWPTPGSMSGFGGWQSAIMVSMGLAVGRMSTQRLTSLQPTLDAVGRNGAPSSSSCFLFKLLVASPFPKSKKSAGAAYTSAPSVEGLGSLHEVMHLQRCECQGLRICVPGRQPFMLVACGVSV